MIPSLKGINRKSVSQPEMDSLFIGSLLYPMKSPAPPFGDREHGQGQRGYL